MTITLRNYNHEKDYNRINEFLIRTYQQGGKYTNWLQPRWEYMVYHPNSEIEPYSSFGVWEDEGNIVAFVNFEDDFGEAFFAYDPDYAFLKNEMFNYAKTNLSKVENGVASLVAHIPDHDIEMVETATRNGFKKDDEWLVFHTISKFNFSKLSDVTLPDGFKIQSLKENNDIYKFNQVLWKGFNHEGEAPLDSIPGRIKMQSAPNYRWDLNMVAVAPNGDYACFVGMFYDEVNHVGYVEPVATDPAYRRMGLAKAAMYESIRRTIEKGVNEIFVESGIDFYLNIGFEKSFYRNKWVKKWKI